MKTIIRVNPHVLDIADVTTASKIPPLAVRMLSDALATLKTDDAQLIVDRGTNGKPTYITLGHNPPELVIGGRKTWGVFAPLDCQDPIATFLSELQAKAWAEQTYGERQRVALVDAPYEAAVAVTVAVLIVRQGKALLGKSKRDGSYSLPESRLLVGESIESAALRACKTLAGINIRRVSVSKTAPYVNTLLNAGQHFITLCVTAEYIDGALRADGTIWASCDWHDVDQLPEPLFVSVKQIIYLAETNTPKEVKVEKPTRRRS